MGQKGAFILGQVYNKQLSLTHPVAISTASQETGYYNTWDLGTAVPQGTYGWVFGGSAGAFDRSLVERIDFSNDSVTALSRGVLTAVRTSVMAASNNNYSWLMFSGVSSVERVDFTNDLNVASVRGPLSSARGTGAATGNVNYGWFAGAAFPATITTIDRIDYSNDLTTASLRGPLSSGRGGMGATSNATYGWFSAGLVSPAQTRSLVDRVDFSNDSVTTSARRSMSASRYHLSAAGNVNYGWFAGGIAPPTVISTIERIDYSNDISNLASPRSTLPTTRYLLAATSNASYGWFIAGWDTTPATYSLVTRLDFANDTVVPIARGVLTEARFGVGASSNYIKTQSTYLPPNSEIQVGGYGWVAGGISPPNLISNVDRINFSNDTVTASVRGTLNTVRYQYYGANNSNYGWFNGGTTTASASLSSVERIDFSNDAVTAGIRGPLTTTRGQVATTSNQNYSWSTGGFTPTQFSSIDRIDFSNDFVIATSRGVLTLARQRAEATGNDNYGWFVGGNGPGGDVSTVERLEYANDLVTPTLRGNMPATIAGGAAAVSNLNYGWFAATSSTLYRIDFSNDTASSAPARGTFSVAKTFTSGSSGNANFGWFSGGSVAGTATSVVERMDYSNDNTTTSSRGPISSARYSAAGTSNYVKEKQFSFVGNNVNGTFGWFSGGYAFPAAPAGQASSIDRIDFSNDSVIALNRITLTAGGYFASATSNINYRWQYGGFAVPGFAVKSTISRLDFSNDTSQPTDRSILPVGVQGSNAFGNSSYGWNIGGAVAAGPSQSTITRLEYANDAASITGRSNAPAATSKSYATANANYGWFGVFTSNSSSIYRMDFGNDLSTPTSRGPLTAAKYGGAATSNSIYGWFGGGRLIPTTGITNVDRIDFANDTVAASARGTLVVGVYKASATGNINYGWWAGGDTGTFPGARSIVSRIDYSNDSASASQRGNLSATRYGSNGSSNYVKTLPQPNVTQYNKGTTAVGTGAGTYGWWAGNAPQTSTVDRLDFSNDSATALARGFLTVAKSGWGFVGNASSGWFSGGSDGVNVLTGIDRIDWSNDLSTALARGNLTIAAGVGALGNVNYGYNMGGSNVGSTVWYSNISRLDYSNDLALVSTRGPMVIAKFSYNGNVANINYGWIGGGLTSPLTPTTGNSRIERLDFSNDSVGTLYRIHNFSYYQQAASSNNNFGWWSGGRPVGSPAETTVWRLDFSNDTAGVTSRGQVTVIRATHAQASSANYSWVAGSVSSTAVDRIDHANDSITAIVRGATTVGRQSVGATSNYTK